MSADLLREAAKVMRERAEASRPAEGCQWYDQDAIFYALLDQGKHFTDEPEAEPLEKDADYLSSWHPAVALAVADWLDEVAETTQFFKDNASTHPAIKVVRAYLGRDA